MKKLILLLFLVLLVTGCSKDGNTLVIVTEAGFAPYEYYENNKIVGIDIDIAEEIAKRLDKELVVKDVAFDSIINELNSGKADIALAGMSITAERQEEVDFSIEYAVSKQVIVALKDTNIKKVSDLNNKTISVQLGSVADSYVTENFKNAKLIQQKKFLSAAEDIKGKKADCLIMDELPATELVKNNPELKILNIELFTDKYAAVVAKGNTKLLEQINEVLQDLIDSGKINEFTINHTK
ncbi:MAG: amino acid ABC transporter substrate-binding protein [Mollicutes bacterium]|jgi:polar amino acid transport system substrate-binding protein|nr:amino acid ABC transporter substrate-binding protein [Mollicutes bacterium]